MGCFPCAIPWFASRFRRAKGEQEVQQQSMPCRSSASPLLNIGLLIARSNLHNSASASQSAAVECGEFPNLHTRIQRSRWWRLGQSILVHIPRQRTIQTNEEIELQDVTCEYNRHLPALIEILKLRHNSPFYTIVNTIALTHLAAILSMDDYAKIPGQISTYRDAVNLLEFCAYIWYKGLSPLRRIELQDVERRLRCFMTELAVATETIPEAFQIDRHEVAQLESETFATGVFVDVYRGEYRNKRVVVRQHRPIMTKKDECREVLLWSTLAHKNILPLTGVYYSTSGRLPTICPFMENGTLLSCRKKIKPSAKEIEQRMLEVADGLQYLHREGVIHCDLHGNNVLLDSYFRATIADFGLSRHSDAAVPPDTSESTLPCRFSAPELLRDDDYPAIRTEETDIFAFACLYYQIYYACPPFSGINEISVPLKVRSGARPRRLPEPALHDRTWTLITECWQQNPADRPCMRTVFNRIHSWQRL